ncbi:anaerobic ribonucleoside triphosphate reductase [Bacillus spongiae]|uniref:Anaerobic ribonucleoside triphosphate reductase n=1 Tax=Bacillus spongiae TaxID=2683610 RepID=A0ABU8HFK7_9BACI
MLVDNERTKELLKTFDEISNTTSSELLNENANMDGRSPMGQMNKFGTESSKYYAVTKLLSDSVKNAIKDNFIHIHDMDFMPMGTTTCCQIPLAKLLANGFNTGHGYIRPPHGIKSALALASIILQANQNMQHGGQALPMFDFDLAPYVRRTFENHLQRLNGYQTFYKKAEKERIAWKETEDEVYQSCEAFIHNSNSMHSRGGSQVPFISINYGTDTSKEGRMIIKNILLATQSGLGKGETPIFPIQIFKTKKGVNFEEGDPNYDMYQLALKTTAMRLYPNFSFIDAPFNIQYYDGTPKSEVSYMGCRTRVMSNLHGEENSIERGNLSFTSINLVKIALKSNNEKQFFALLESYCDLVIQQLYERYLHQCTKKAKDFSFLYSQGIWKGSEELQGRDSLETVLKQGTLSIGFIGLAEALMALMGFHHGESEKAWTLGYKIVQFLREKADLATEEYQLNFSLIATPAEGLSGKFTKHDQLEFGEIKGVTNRPFYTNSFHIPVYYPIKAIDKIRKEGPFHELCNAGHITYIESDGNLVNNLSAIDQLVKAMHANHIGYGSINHPVDYCKNCSYSGIINQECPVCHTTEEGDISRIRRITGYLVGDMSKWNSAKKQEEKNRVRHQ